MILRQSLAFNNWLALKIYLEFSVTRWQAERNAKLRVTDATLPVESALGTRDGLYEQQHAENDIYRTMKSATLIIPVRWKKVARWKMEGYLSDEKIIPWSDYGLGRRDRLERNPVLHTVVGG